MRPSLGATFLADDRCRFLVWAPFAEAVDLRIVSPHARIARLDRDTWQVQLLAVLEKLAKAAETAPEVGI